MDKFNDTFNDGVKACMIAIDNYRVSQAGDLKDPKCKGQRGSDRFEALYDAYKLIGGLIKNE